MSRRPDVPAAQTYQRDLSRLSSQAVALILALWRRLDRRDITGSWRDSLPQLLAILVAAQTVAAEMADPYLDAQLAEVGVDPESAGEVDPEAFAAAAADGRGLAGLMYLPAVEASAALQAGVAAELALLAGQHVLMRIIATEVPDAGRTSVATAIGARPHVGGYYRRLRPPSCARCAILAGKFFRWNDGFQRHPRCDCTHQPVGEADNSLAYDARKAIESGQVTGLSAADRRAIVEFGANPAQVVNVRRGGLYTAGGRQFTSEGTTRRGVAGARILARDIERSLRGQSTGQTFRNMTFDRHLAAEYAALFRRGKTYTRRTAGGSQTYAYRFTRTGRPTPEQILRDATSRQDAIRLFINNGYLL